MALSFLSLCERTGSEFRGDLVEKERGGLVVEKFWGFRYLASIVDKFTSSGQFTFGFIYSCLFIPKKTHFRKNTKHKTKTVYPKDICCLPHFQPRLHKSLLIFIVFVTLFYFKCPNSNFFS